MTQDVQYRLMVLQRDVPGALHWFEVALARIEQASHRLGGNPALLKTQVWELFSKASPLLAIWLAMKDGQVVGHMLAQVQTWDGRLVGWINQAEMDMVAGRHLKDESLNALENWVHHVNAQLKPNNLGPIRELMMVTRRHGEKVFDPWARHVGFTPELVIYRREVSGIL